MDHAFVPAISEVGMNEAARQALESSDRVNEDLKALVNNERFMHVCGGCGFYVSGIMPKGTKLYSLCPNCGGRVMQQTVPAIAGS